jgi:flagellar hook-associated protein 3 FlgL
MSIDRVANLTQSAFLSSQINRQEAKISDLTTQVSSGQVSDSYSGYGDQTMAMESARAVVNRTSGYQTATTLATTQCDLQDSLLDQLSTLSSNLKTAISEAVATGDGSSLKTTCSNTFDQASAILNYQDSNGNYVFGGGNNATKPFTVSSFSDLATATLSDSFVNGQTVKSVQVADGQSLDYGLNASNVGTDLMTTLQEISSTISTDGDFSTSLTQSQQDYLSNEISSAQKAYASINTISAQNGDTYQQLETAADTQTTMLTLYKGFVSGVQDVDMATVSTDLTNAQTALQAVTLVTSTLNQVSLLDYLS